MKLPDRSASPAIARGILQGLLACAMLVGLSIGFIDRPLALFIHAHLPPGPGTARFVLQAMARIAELTGGVAMILLVGLGLLRVARGRLSGLAEIGFLFALSVVIAETVKTALKLAFGRAWPETWVNGNPSLIRDGVYGFFPFTGEPGWASFPSGHTTAVCAGMMVLWLLLPRGRPLYTVAALAVPIGLVGMNAHFLGDILAGAYLGGAVGIVTVHIGRNRL